MEPDWDYRDDWECANDWDPPVDRALVNASKKASRSRRDAKKEAFEEISLESSRESVERETRHSVDESWQQSSRYSIDSPDFVDPRRPNRASRKMWTQKREDSSEEVQKEAYAKSSDPIIIKQLSTSSSKSYQVSKGSSMNSSLQIPVEQPVPVNSANHAPVEKETPTISSKQWQNVVSAPRPMSHQPSQQTSVNSLQQASTNSLKQKSTQQEMNSSYGKNNTGDEVKLKNDLVTMQQTCQETPEAAPQCVNPLSAFFSNLILGIKIGLEQMENAVQMSMQNQTTVKPPECTPENADQNPSPEVREPELAESNEEDISTNDEEETETFTSGEDSVDDSTLSSHESLVEDPGKISVEEIAVMKPTTKSPKVARPKQKFRILGASPKAHQKKEAKKFRKQLPLPAHQLRVRTRSKPRSSSPHQSTLEGRGRPKQQPAQPNNMVRNRSRSKSQQPYPFDNKVRTRSKSRSRGNQTPPPPSPLNRRVVSRGRSALSPSTPKSPRSPLSNMFNMRKSQVVEVTRGRSASRRKSRERNERSRSSRRHELEGGIEDEFEIEKDARTTPQKRRPSHTHSRAHPPAKQTAGYEEDDSDVSSHHPPKQLARRRSEKSQNQKQNATANRHYDDDRPETSKRMHPSNYKRRSVTPKKSRASSKKMQSPKGEQSNLSKTCLNFWKSKHTERNNQDPKDQRVAEGKIQKRGKPANMYKSKINKRSRRKKVPANSKQREGHTSPAEIENMIDVISKFKQTAAKLGLTERDLLDAVNLSSDSGQDVAWS